MSTQQITRRQLLEKTGLATAALVGSSLLDSGNALAAGPFVRRDVGTLTASSPTIVSYAKAVKKMKALPTTNPLSWTYQAAIHGTTLSGTHPAWNTCQHGNYFFFSWHRMYLWYFERIVRKLSGDAAWALPFWNYESASERKLPAPFRSPAAATNPLYTPNRGAGWNAGTASLNASAVATAAAMANVPFNSFSSSLEGTPHGAVHVSVGGWMGSVPTAAQDPIFWLHHSNIDRLWNLWLTKGGGRTDPLGDTAWKNTKFTFFDENGNPVKLTGCGVLRAAQQLNYVYQNEPPQVKLFCPLVLTSSPAAARWSRQELMSLPAGRTILLPPGPDPVPADLDIRAVRERLQSDAAAEEAEVVLDLSGIEADRQPNVYYEVYVGLPKGEKPQFNSPYYVGNIALFGHGVRDAHQHGGFQPASFSFKINRAVQEALKQIPTRGQLPILFVPRGAAQANEAAGVVRSVARIKIGKAALSTRRLVR